MIQFDYNNNFEAFSGDFADAINGDIKPLVEFKSQQTNKSLFFLPLLVVTTNIERYVQILVFGTGGGNVEDPLNGYITLANTDYPYGFYDVTIYKNTSNTNLNPNTVGVEPVYHTLMNLWNRVESPTTFTKYTNNDTDTNSVYITY
tara:strand:+ start:5263 stop:5700 length:438 start_codon:yes stop_codon:yes gene_type:complete